MGDGEQWLLGFREETDAELRLMSPLESGPRAFGLPHGEGAAAFGCSPAPALVPTGPRDFLVLQLPRLCSSRLPTSHLDVSHHSFFFCRAPPQPHFLIVHTNFRAAPHQNRPHQLHRGTSAMSDAGSSDHEEHAPNGRSSPRAESEEAGNARDTVEEDGLDDADADDLFGDTGDLESGDEQPA